MHGSGSFPITLPRQPINGPIDVEVWGGLGNRLFMLAAGFCIARILDRPLRVLTHSQQSLVEVIGGLEPDGLFGALGYTPQVVPIPRQRNAMLTRLRERAGILVSQLKIVQEAPTDGGRMRVFSDNDGSRVLMQGYFQDVAIMLYAVDLGWPTKAPLKESDERWLASKSRQALGLHVRQGDYLNSVNQVRLGSPSPEYYRQALGHLGVDSDDEIWLFSDEPLSAVKFLRQGGVEVTATFGPDDSPTEGAAIALMGRTTGLVMSNSTFSWWGAFWGPHSRGVLYPEPWHDRVDARSLPSPGWTPLAKYPRDSRRNG